jgi:hypothetical protein
LSRDVGNCIKPILVNLLLSAFFIKIDNDKRLICFKISRGVIEGEVSIFTNAYKGDIYGMVFNDFIQPVAFCMGIVFIRIDEMSSL